MKNSSLFARGLLHSGGVLIYVLLLTTFFSKANSWFGATDRDIFSPAGAMMMLVFSALVTGGLVLAKPLMMYIDGQKKEALKLLFFTGFGLLIFTIFIFLVLAWLNR